MATPCAVPIRASWCEHCVPALSGWWWWRSRSSHQGPLLQGDD
jgi:hypothetical protein